MIVIPRGWSFNGWIPYLNPKDDALTDIDWASLKGDLFYTVAPFATVTISVKWAGQRDGCFELNVTINNKDYLPEDTSVTNEFYMTKDLNDLIHTFNLIVDEVQVELDRASTDFEITE